ncbi:hypothetical protein Hanom_Chr01g00001681 [Helianthus anomalus]
MTASKYGNPSISTSLIFPSFPTTWLTSSRTLDNISGLSSSSVIAHVIMFEVVSVPAINKSCNSKGTIKISSAYHDNFQRLAISV